MSDTVDTVTTKFGFELEDSTLNLLDKKLKEIELDYKNIVDIQQKLNEITGEVTTTVKGYTDNLQQATIVIRTLVEAEDKFGVASELVTTTLKENASIQEKALDLLIQTSERKREQEKAERELNLTLEEGFALQQRIQNQNAVAESEQKALAIRAEIVAQRELNRTLGEGFALQQSIQNKNAVAESEEKALAIRDEILAQRELRLVLDEGFALQQKIRNENTVAESEARALAIKAEAEAENKYVAILEQKILLNEGEIARINREAIETETKAEKELVATLEQEIILNKGLIVQENERQRIAAQNKANATTAFGRLGTAIPVGATVDEINAQTAAANKLVAFVERGEVSLQRLFEITASVAKGNLLQLNEVEQKVAAIAQEHKQATEQLGAQNERLVEQFASVGKAGEKAANVINLSWQSLSRFFAVHLLYTFFYKLTGALKESVAGAAEFERHIAEIQTISQQGERDTSAWVTSLRQLSDEFGKPVGEVAEATYQAISNQVVTATNATKFLTQALELARVTASTTDQSVNLLSSVLNSYHLSASEAGDVSAKLFKIIELGRVRAEDIANIFGRVGAISNSLGVSFEEVGASLSTLTRSGVKPAEALTLINNVILKLGKPTEELRDVFKSLGYENAQAALSANGFGGVLQLLEKAAHGSRSELIEMFRDIRAVRGALGLTDAFDTYTSDLNKITTATASFNNALKIANENAGFKLQEQLTRLKNLFTVDFGVNFITFLEKINDELTSGIFANLLADSDGLIGGLKKLIQVVGELGLAFGAMRAVQRLFKAEQEASLVINETEVLSLQKQIVIRQFLSGAITEEQFTLAQINLAQGEEKIQLELTNLSLQKQAVIRQYLAGTIGEEEFAIQKLTFALKEEQLAAKGVNTGLGTGASLGIFAAATGLFLLFTAIKNEQEEIQDTAQKTFDKEQLISKEITRINQEQLEKQKAAFNKNVDEKFAAFIKFSAELVQVIDNLKEREEEAYREIADKTKVALEQSLNNVKEHLRDLSSTAKEAEGIVKSSNKSIKESQEKLTNTLFDFKIKGLAEDQQFEEIKKEIDKRVTGINKDVKGITLRIDNQIKTGRVDKGFLDTDKEDIDVAKKNIDQVYQDIVKQNDKVIELRKEKATIEQRLAEKETKAEENSDIRQAAADLRLLKAKRASNKEISEATQKLAALRAAIAGNRSDREIEQDQKRLDVIDKELAALGDQNAAIDKLNELIAIKNKLDEDSIRISQEQIAEAKKQKESEEKRLITLRQTILEFNKFKLTNQKGELIFDSSQKAVETFGEKFQKIIAELGGPAQDFKAIQDQIVEGLVTSPQQLENLIKPFSEIIQDAARQEYQIKTQYDERFREESLKRLQGDSAAVAEIIKKQQQVLLDAQNKATEDRTKTVDEFIGTIAQIKAQATAAFGGTGIGDIGNDLSKLQNIAQILSEFKRTGDTNLLGRISDNLDIPKLLEYFKARDNDPLLAKGDKNFKIGDKTTDFITFIKTISQFANKQTTAQKNIADAQALIKLQQTELETFNNQIQSLSSSLNLVGTNFQQIFNAATTGMQKILNDVRTFNDNVKDKLPKTYKPNEPISQVYSNIPTPLASAVGSNFNFGDINVEVKGGGPNQMSVKDFANQMRNAVRQRLFVNEGTA